MRAVRKQKTDDFWIVAKQKKLLKRETRDYIPKYIAAMLIAKDPEKYGFTDIEYAPQLDYEKVSIPGATDLRVIAKACECSVEEIKELNPELLRWFTPPNLDEYKIKLPAEKTEAFRVNFAEIPPQERLNFLVHKVKKGETLSTIAKRYGSPVEAILHLNRLKSVRYVKAGTEIVVPVRAGSRPGKKLASPEAVRPPQKG